MAALYALLVGINRYKHIRPLNGCRRDVERMEATLRELFPQQIHQHSFLRLFDDEATKEGLVNAFRQQLCRSDIQPGDTALFYFSGHGGQEIASTSFGAAVPNGRLENLACHDSDLSSGARFLADKELRFLLREAAREGVEVVTIFDCCHAGGNTRSIGHEEAPVAGPTVRLTGLAGQREWKDFIFSNGIQESLLQSTNLDQLLPEGQHIQLAACGSEELATELPDGGVFTAALLDTLKAFQGKLNYYELSAQVRRRVKAGFQQTPQVYIYAGGVGMGSAGNIRQAWFKNILGSTIIDRPILPTVSFSPLLQRWVLDVGAIYGIQTHWKDEPQRLPLYSGERLVGYAGIEEVQASQTILRTEENADLVPTKEYRTLVPSFLSKGLNLFLRPHIASRSALDQRLRQSPGLWIVDAEADADYCIDGNAEEWWISLPGDQRPLSRQTGVQEPEILAQQLNSIGKWNFVKELKHPGSTLPDSILDIRFFLRGTPLEMHDGVLTLPMEGRSLAGVDLHITNRYGEPLHLAVLSLSSLFGIDPWLDERVELLDSGKSKELNGIEFYLEDFIVDNGWDQESLYLMIIAGEERFEVDLLSQVDLEPPRRGATRGAGRPASNKTKKPSWRTFLVECRLPNRLSGKTGA